MPVLRVVGEPSDEVQPVGAELLERSGRDGPPVDVVDVGDGEPEGIGLAVQERRQLVLHERHGLLAEHRSVGGKRKTRLPCALAIVSPTAPVSQNSMPFDAAAADAGAEIVLP
jgi:hypothetical protein